jgi:DNA repair ATPase RecN
MDPKSLQQIEDYLTASGLRADELRKRMDEIKASTVEFNRELINAQRHAADLNRDFNDLSSQFKNIVDDLRKWDSTSTKINKSYKTLGGLADKLKYDSENISRLSKKDLESLDKKARIELSNLKARKAELDIKFQNKNLDQIRSQALINDDKELLKQLDQYNELNQTFDEKGNLINDENNAIKTLLALTQERLKEEEKINRTLGISGKLVDGIVGTLGKLGIESSFFENLKEDMRDAAKSGDGLLFLLLLEVYLKE